MWKFLLTLIVVAASSGLSGSENSCEESYGFRVCKDPSGALLVEQLDEGGWLILDRKGISSIGPDSFLNLTTNLLTISADNSTACSPSIIDITPESFQGLSFVETIIIKCVKLRGASNPFKNLNSLHLLRLSDNGFTEFPQELCADIASLKILDVSHQQIRTLSPASFLNIAEGLQKLRLESNDLELIEPQTFQRFRVLDSLELTENNLDIIGPDMFNGLDQLTVLYLNGNRLKEIKSGTFSSLLNLEIINLGKNHLESLPDDIFNNLKHLKSLNLHDNAISTVPYNLLQGLDELRTLSLGFSENIKIEPNAFRGLNLRDFWLNADRLSVLGGEVFSGLSTKYLFLHRNNTIDFQRNLFKGLVVKEVYIYEDNMTEINRQSWGLENSVTIYSRTEDVFFPRTSRYPDA